MKTGFATAICARAFLKISHNINKKAMSPKIPISAAMSKYKLCAEAPRRPDSSGSPITTG